MADTALQSNVFGSLSTFGSRKMRSPSDKELQRAAGCVRIVLESSNRGTRIADVYQQSPVRILFPNASGGAIEEAVLLNTAGGIAGGDRLEYSVTALTNASIAVTSQAAERVYRALNEPARVVTRLKAHEGAKPAWLPQETIVFNRARFRRDTEIELSSGAELLALEWLVLGRAAHGDEMSGGYLSDSWRVTVDGKLVWADCFRATDEVFPHLSKMAMLSNCKAVGTLIYFGDCIAARLEFLRHALPVRDSAATAVGGLIIVRFAAKLPSELRLTVGGLLERLSRELGPGPFRKPKMWSC